MKGVTSWKNALVSQKAGTIGYLNQGSITWGYAPGKNKDHPQETHIWLSCKEMWVLELVAALCVGDHEFISSSHIIACILAFWRVNHLPPKSLSDQLQTCGKYD